MSGDDNGQRCLTPEELGWSCPQSWLGFSTTRELEPKREIFGQARAVGGLRMALRLRAKGFNVYVAGSSGTGRVRTVRHVLEEERQTGETPPDLCYAVNFEDARTPRCLRLPPGKARILRDALASAGERFRSGLAALRASDEHRQRRELVTHVSIEEQSRLLADFQDEVATEGFEVVEVSLGPFQRHELVPVVDDQALSFDELAGAVREGKVSEERVKELRARHPVLAARLAQTASRYRALTRELEQALEETDRNAGRPLVEEVVEDVRETVGIEPELNEEFDEYLDEVAGFLLDVFPILFAAGERVTPDGEGGAPTPPDPLDALRINVMADRSGLEGRPLVIETNPTQQRLFGWVDATRQPDGELRADLSSLRPGAFHRADGGFLLVNAHDLMAEDGTWAILRRVLRTGMVTLSGGSAEGPAPLAPDPHHVDVKVILVGTAELRDAIADEDHEFDTFFKVVSIFEERIELTEDHVRSFVEFLAHVIDEEGLLPLERGAVARMLASMVRLAGGREKVSTHLRLFTDLAREASWMATEQGRSLVTREDVEATLAARRHRAGFLSARILEAIENRVLLLNTEGEAVGQVNALAVVQTSLEEIGYPARITATTAVGRAGIIDIEREAELSGEIHTKASLILGGYLRSLFAQTHPLAITASLCFEQSYGGVEGDSASCAELVALLSSLSDVPVRQDLAVTGAVDQHGHVLAVGGLNEKTEGFWRACQRRGFTGTQGVILPASAAPELQLLPELVDDVRDGRFHVYVVETVEELVELMMGCPLGRPGADGAWPEGCLGASIADRLARMAGALRDYGHPGA